MGKEIRHASESVQDDLESLFPDVGNLLSGENIEGYWHFQICACDSPAHNDTADAIRSLKVQNPGKLFEFGIVLSQSTEHYFVRLKNARRMEIQYRQYKTDEILAKRLSAPKEPDRALPRVVVLPQIEMVYRQSVGESHDVFLRDYQSLAIIERLAPKFGLHIANVVDKPPVEQASHYNNVRSMHA